MTVRPPAVSVLVSVNDDPAGKRYPMLTGTFALSQIQDHRSGSLTTGMVNDTKESRQS